MAFSKVLPEAKDGVWRNEASEKENSQEWKDRWFWDLIEAVQIYTDMHNMKLEGIFPIVIFTP